MLKLTKAQAAVCEWLAANPEREVVLEVGRYCYRPHFRGPGLYPPRMNRSTFEVLTRVGVLVQHKVYTQYATETTVDLATGKVQTFDRTTTHYRLAEHLRYELKEK